VRRSVSSKDFKMVNNWWRRPSQDPRPGGSVPPSNDCWVCEKYDICQNRIVARFGSEDLDHWTFFDPLEEAPDLFLRFARLHRERDFAQAALRFTHQYGLPCGTSREDPNVNVSDRPEQLTFQRYFEESQRAWVVVSLYESVLNRDEDTARSLLSDYRHLDDVFEEQYFDMLNIDLPEDTAPSTALQCALAAAVFTVDPVVREPCNQSIFVHIDGMDQPDPSAVKLTWFFDNLLGAMYLQMHWLLTSGGNLVRCEYCRRVISLARPHPQGRKRRRDKRFCDDAYRQAHHRSKKRT
jgi:hypothetical protein